MAFKVSRDRAGRQVVEVSGLLDLPMAQRLLVLFGELEAGVPTIGDFSHATGLQDGALELIANGCGTARAPIELLGLRGPQLALLRSLGFGSLCSEA